MKSRVLKIFSAVMVLVMCLGMTAMAAESPAAGVVTKINKAVDANGNDITGKVVVQEVAKSEFPAEYQAVVDEVKTEAGLKAALAAVGVAWDENLVVADVKDVDIVGDKNAVAFPVTITFEMKGVVPASKVIVLHWTGSAWEKVDSTVGEGTVTATFNSLSPVAFIVDKTTLSSGTKSPKTSASSTAAVALLGMSALVAVCGLRKKSVLR